VSPVHPDVSVNISSSPSGTSTKYNTGFAFDASETIGSLLQSHIFASGGRSDAVVLSIAMSPLVVLITVGADGVGFNIVGIGTGAVGAVMGVIGSVTCAVGAVTGAVGAFMGAVGAVTGAVGTVTGAVGTVTGAVGTVTGAVGTLNRFVGDSIAASVGLTTGAAGFGARGVGFFFFCGGGCFALWYYSRLWLLGWRWYIYSLGVDRY